MKLYRKDNRTGFIEEINTDGTYHPLGWSTSKRSAKRNKGYTSVLPLKPRLTIKKEKR